MTAVRSQQPQGVVTGELAPDEDIEALARTLASARDAVLDGDLLPLVHDDLTDGDGSTQRQQCISRLKTGRLKRYVVRVETSAGPRIVKLNEPVGPRDLVRRFFAPSQARREHRNHARAMSHGLAVTDSSGFLEFHRGWRLLRSAQIQRVLDPSRQTLTQFLEHRRREEGISCYRQLGRALAETHDVPFFHADLKGFHAFPKGPPHAYRLQWLDLGRCGFRVSPRRRVINLYQALRFVVPDERDAQQEFVFSYCETSGWHAKDPKRGLNRVMKFLEYKLRTHPLP